MKSSSNLLRLIEQRNSAAATELIAQSLGRKAAQRISEHRRFVAGDVYGRLVEFVSGDDQPIYTNPNDNAYIEFFKAALNKFGVEDPKALTDEQTKRNFFDYVDKGWQAMTRGGQPPIASAASPTQAVSPVGTTPTFAQSKSQTQQPKTTSMNQPKSPMADADSSTQEPDTFRTSREQDPIGTANGFDVGDDEEPDESGDETEFQDAPGGGDAGLGDDDHAKVDPRGGAFGTQDNAPEGDDDGNISSDDGNLDSDFGDEDSYTIDPAEFLIGLLDSRNGEASDDNEGGTNTDEDQGDDDEDDHGLDRDADEVHGDDEYDADGDDEDPDDEGDSTDDEDEEGGHDSPFKKTTSRSFNEGLLDQFLVEQHNAFKQVEKEIQDHPKMTPDEKTQRLQDLRSREAKFHKTVAFLRQIQNDRNIEHRRLAKERGGLARDSSTSPEEKKRQKQLIAQMAQKSRTYHKNRARDVNALHKPMGPTSVPTVRQPAKSRKPVTQQAKSVPTGTSKPFSNGVVKKAKRVQ